MTKGACDCHCHIIDPRFPAPGPVPTGMTLDDYLMYQPEIGTTRAIFVQAKLHGIDHTCLVDALKRMGAEARGIAVLRADVADSELRRLDAVGIRGVRFSLWNPRDAVTSLDMIAPLAARISALGWHVQVHMSADQIIENKALFYELPCPIVFDHMARIPGQVGIDHPAFDFVCGLATEERAWLKLSGPYLNSSSGKSSYDDLRDLARGLVARIPGRLVWGSDWPHITEAQKPKSSVLLDLLVDWRVVGPLYHRVFVEAPNEIY